MTQTDTDIQPEIDNTNQIEIALEKLFGKIKILIRYNIIQDDEITFNKLF